MRYAGGTIKDTLCIEQNNVCVEEFEFFVIRNQTDETRNAIMRTDGVMGLAPDQADNGPSFLTSLRARGIITHHQVGVRMYSNG